MLAVIALSAAVVLGAADVKNEAWVVITKRSGIARPAAMQMARTVADTLAARGVPSSTEPADLTACNAKLVCLVEAALKKKVAVLITIETASVLEDVLIHTEALSIEEDGKKIGSFDFEGPVRQFSADAAKKVDDSFVPAIRSTLGIAAAPVAKEAPPPADTILAAPQPAPKPDPVAEVPTAPATVTQAPSKGLSTGQVVGIAVAGAGVVTLGSGIAMGIKALGASGQQRQLCPAGQPCTNPAAFNSFNEARSAQSTGLMLAVVGGVLVAGGATLVLVSMGGSHVAVAAAPSSEGGAVFVSGSF